MAILICTRNHAAWLARLLKAIVQVNCSSVARIIVVDNASSDNTRAVVDGFAGGRSVVPTEYAREDRVGVAHARRRAIRMTDEPIVAFLDDDVLPADDWAVHIHTAFMNDEQVGAVGSRVLLRWPRRPSALASACRLHLAQQDLGECPKTLTDSTSGFVTAAIGLRREAIESSGWLEHGVLTGRRGDQLSGGEDYELCIRIRRAGWKLRYEPEARCEHLIPPDRLTRSYLARLVRQLGESDPWLRWIADGEPHDPHWTSRDAQRLTRSLRRSRLLEWRPNRRLLRINDRAGRLSGLRSLQAHLAEPAA